MPIYRLEGHNQLVSDGCIGLAGSEQPQYLELARGEQVRRRMPAWGR
jgi:hypothetical protein